MSITAASPAALRAAERINAILEEGLWRVDGLAEIIHAEFAAEIPTPKLLKERENMAQCIANLRMDRAELIEALRNSLKLTDCEAAYKVLCKHENKTT